MARFSSEQIIDLLTVTLPAPVGSFGGVVVVDRLPVSDYDYVRVTMQVQPGTGAVSPTQRVVLNCSWQSQSTFENVATELNSSYTFIFPFSDFGAFNPPFDPATDFRYPTQTINIPVMERYIYLSVNDPQPPGGTQVQITLTLIKCNQSLPLTDVMTEFWYFNVQNGANAPGLGSVYVANYLYIGVVYLTLNTQAPGGAPGTVYNIYELGMAGLSPPAPLITVFHPAVTVQELRIPLRHGPLYVQAVNIGGVGNNLYNIVANPIID